MQEKIHEWEERFNELTKSMDGQYRPKLRLLIQEQITLAFRQGVESERKRISDIVRRNSAYANFLGNQKVIPADGLLSIINSK